PPPPRHLVAQAGVLLLASEQLLPGGRPLLATHDLVIGHHLSLPVQVIFADERCAAGRTYEHDHSSWWCRGRESTRAGARVPGGVFQLRVPRLLGARLIRREAP